MCCNCPIGIKLPITARRGPSMKDTKPDSSQALWTCHSVDGPFRLEPKSQARSVADVVCGFVDASNSIVGLASYL